MSCSISAGNHDANNTKPMCKGCKEIFKASQIQWGKEREDLMKRLGLLEEKVQRQKLKIEKQKSDNQLQKPKSSIKSNGKNFKILERKGDLPIIKDMIDSDKKEEKSKFLKNGALKNYSFIQPRIDQKSNPIHRRLPTSEFIEAFIKNSPCKYSELQNEIIEQYETPLRSLKDASPFPDFVQSYQRSKRQIIKYIRYQALYSEGTFAITVRGGSRAVRKARKQIELYLKTKFRTIRRYLLIPREISKEVDLEKTMKLSIVSEVLNCVCRLTADGEDTLFAKFNLAKKNLSQIELLGYPEACDNAEEIIVSIVKRSVKEPDCRLSIPFKSAQTINNEKNKEKVLKKTMCVLAYNEGIEVFSGSKNRLYEALHLIETIHNEMTSGIIKETINIGRKLTKIINLNFVSSVLDLFNAENPHKTFKANRNEAQEKSEIITKETELIETEEHDVVEKDIIKKKEKLRNDNLKLTDKATIEVTCFDNNDKECFDRFVDYLIDFLEPKKTATFKISKQKILKKLIPCIEKENNVILRVVSDKGENSECKVYFFSHDQSSIGQVEDKIKVLINEKPKIQVKIRQFQKIALSRNTIKGIEEKHNVVLRLTDKRIENRAKQNAEEGESEKINKNGDLEQTKSFVKIYGFGEESDWESASLSVKKAVSEFEKNPTSKITIPLAREHLLTHEALKEVEKENQVLIKRKPNSIYENKTEVVFCVYGDEKNCKNLQNKLEEICLMKKPPTLTVELSSEELRVLLKDNKLVILDIQRETGCLIFAGKSKQGVSKLSMKEAVAELYGNKYACSIAAKKISDVVKIGTKKKERTLIVPESDLEHICKDKEMLLRKVEARTGCEIKIPSLVSRDPLDKEIPIRIVGPNEEKLSEAEKKLRSLTSLLSKVENKIVRVRKITKETAKRLEQNESKMLFIVQEETRCNLTITRTLNSEEFLLCMRGSQSTCDAAEAQLNIICN